MAAMLWNFCAVIPVDRHLSQTGRDLKVGLASFVARNDRGVDVKKGFGYNSRAVMTYDTLLW